MNNPELKLSAKTKKAFTEIRKEAEKLKKTHSPQEGFHREVVCTYKDIKSAKK